MNTPKKILCAVDFGSLTEKILMHSKELASCVNAKIYVVYVVRSLDTIEQFAVPRSYREEYEKEMIEQANEKAREFKESIFPDIDVEFVIKNGEPVREILNFIDAQGIDLVIIGAATNKSFGETLFGSVGEKVLKLSKVPVLVIK